MPRYARVYRFRLTHEEHERFEKEAAAQECSKADLIRRALGWETWGLPPGEETVKRFERKPTAKAPDPEAEPGNAALARLGDRVRESLAR